MTEKPEVSTESRAATPNTGSTPRDQYNEHRPTPIYHALALVGIVAGAVFIVAVIFVSGVIAGRASGGYQGWHRGYQTGQTGPDGAPDDGCLMWGPGGMMGPGGSVSGCQTRGPGGMMGPGQPYPTMMSPSSQRPS